MNPERDKSVLDYRPSPQPSPIWPLVRAAVAIAGIAPTLLGFMWIYTFTMTTRRAHLAPIGIPLGIVTAVIGLAMIAVPFVYARRKRR